MIRSVLFVFLTSTIINCQLSIVNCVSAQANVQQQYSNAKSLFKEGKYNLAMEGFKSLIAYDKENPFSEYASFYYALSAYHQGYKSVAKDMLLQIRQLYPHWDQLDEVGLWLGKIQFDNKEYFQAMHQLNALKTQKLQKDIQEIKRSGLASLTDVQTLLRLHEEYPKDAVVGERLAAELSKSGMGKEDQELLEKLVSTFKLKKSEYITGPPPTIFKDTYSVSVLFPFQVNTLEPTLARKRNQSVLDLYEGMKMAVDTLGKMGVNISLRAYDTDRNPEKIKSILELDELRQTDLLVGPLFQEENDPVQEFSRKYKINLFNPVTNNFDLVSDNPYGFLFQPSLETLGEQSAKFMGEFLKRKTCMVFMGNTSRDSVLAMSFLNAALDTDLKITQIKGFTKESSSEILKILATPTEFDEFKYPTQFTLPKDCLGGIFVASDDPLIYTKVISSVTTRGDSILILGSESWLDQTSDYEKLNALGVVMFSSNFTPPDNALYKAFIRKFIRIHGRTSSTLPFTDYAKIGYDFMLFAGTLLKKHGVYFQHGLNKSAIPGYLTEGYDFQYSRDNRHVPFIRFHAGELVRIVPGKQ
jgi:tetratricopeptide (TPR) repeat protein